MLREPLPSPSNLERWARQPSSRPVTGGETESQRLAPYHSAHKQQSRDASSGLWIPVLMLFSGYHNTFPEPSTGSPTFRNLSSQLHPHSGIPAPSAMCLSPSAVVTSPYSAKVPWEAQVSCLPIINNKYHPQLMDYVEQCCSEHTLCASELPEFHVKMQLLALRVWVGGCPGPSVSNKMHLGRIAWVASGQPAVGPFSTSPAWSVPPALFPHHLSPETQGTRTRDPPSFRGHAGRLVGNASFRALWGCSPSSRGPARG